MSMPEVKNEKGWALFRGFFTRASVPHSSFWVRWLVGIAVAALMVTAGTLGLATIFLVIYLLFEVFSFNPLFTTCIFFITGFGTLIASFKP
jgi:hypothetical protein